jgi:hypothetical protein
MKERERESTIGVDENVEVFVLLVFEEGTLLEF